MCYLYVWSSFFCNGVCLSHVFISGEYELWKVRECVCARGAKRVGKVFDELRKRVGKSVCDDVEIDIQCFS